MKRLVLALLLLSLVASPVAAAAIETPDRSVADTGKPGSAEIYASQANASTATPATPLTPATTETPTPSTASSSASTPIPGERPSSAATVRVLPVQLGPDFVSTRVGSSGERYNTSGPFAFFSLSAPVEEVAIQQPGATASIVGDGTVVKVEYEADAAPVGEQSLYTLVLYFPDGSSRPIDLYAERTSVDVGSTQMAEYRPVVMRMLEDAEDAGYDRTPEGLEQHYTDVRETAQLLESLLTEQAARLFASGISIVTNPLGIVLLLIAAAVIAAWQLRQNKEALEILSNDSGKAARQRERLWIQYREDQQTAADEPLRELRGVGEMNEIYWSDAFDVDTVAGLAELFRNGVAVRRDGEIEHVGGVDALDVDSIESSWLDPITRDHRIPTTEIALTHGKRALHRMVTKYGMAHHYQDAYERVVEILEDLDESRDLSGVSSTSGRDLGTGAAAGGD